ncbi:MAG: hypothetical protein M5U08_19770 [Burkholderiales bacterium]|nr:hypothetical protein [Burkholderiales bacterium]
MALEHCNGVYDHRHRLDRRGRIARGEKVEQPIQIGQGPRAMRDRGRSWRFPARSPLASTPHGLGLARRLAPARARM